MRLPLDLVIGRPPGQELPASEPAFVAALQQRMEVTRQRVSQNLRVAGQAMWQWYQQRARGAQYAVGDKVWLHNPQRKHGLSPKLQSPWEGPYTVLQALSGVTYKISGGARRRPLIVRVDRLWTYAEPGQFTWGHGDAAWNDAGNSDAPVNKSGVVGTCGVSEGAVVHGETNESSDENIDSDRDQRKQVLSLTGRPRRPRKRPVWWKDYVDSDDTSDDE